MARPKPSAPRGGQKTKKREPEIRRTQIVEPSVPPPPAARPLPATLVLLASHRVPKGTHPTVARFADRCLQRIEDVLEERVEPVYAGHVLRAAQLGREEVCGAIVRDVNLTGRLTLEDLVREATVAALPGHVPPDEAEDDLAALEESATSALRRST